MIFRNCMVASNHLSMSSDMVHVVYQDRRPKLLTPISLIGLGFPEGKGFQTRRPWPGRSPYREHRY
jgi:hypothetical protein